MTRDEYLALYEAAPTADRGILERCLACLDGYDFGTLERLAYAVGFRRIMRSRKAALEALRNRVLGRHDTAVRVRDHTQ